jgi:ACS family sodium-dependent inorganic phosphate cotransporter
MVSFVRLIVNLDRMAFSFLVVTMASEFDWSTADQGRVKSAFAFGYMFTQIPGGILGDRTGNKKFQSLALAAFALGLCGIPPLISALGTKSSPRVVEYINFAIGF